jgi:hypothetical protein
MMVQGLGAPDVKTLSFDAEVFKAAFNESADRVRLVGVFSPTCAHCLVACSEIQEILTKYPDARVQVFLLWTPFMQYDNLSTVRRAVEYLPDQRVEHFWDLWRYASRIYTEQLKIPPLHAWDMVVGYKPHLVWKQGAPEPTFWMQNRNLDIGKPFEKEDLEVELLKWAK